MGQFLQHASDFYRYRGARQAGNERRPGRQQQYVRANACGPCAAILQHAEAKSDDQQDQRNLKRNRHHADQRAQRPMHQIPDDHAIHHVFKIPKLLAPRVRNLGNAGIVVIEVNHLGPRRLVKNELIVG